MKTIARTIGAVLTVALPTTAVAHPGHGPVEAQGPLHYLIDHPLLMVAVGAAVVAGGVMIVRRICSSSR